MKQYVGIFQKSGTDLKKKIKISFKLCQYECRFNTTVIQTTDCE